MSKLNIRKGVFGLQTLVFTTVVVLIATFMLLPVDQTNASSTVTYDISNDMVSGSNPSGTWSYGWKAYPGDSFHSYDSCEPDSIIKLPLWHSASIINYWKIPAAWKNISLYDNTGAKPGEVSLHPGPDGEYSVVRWASPASGTITVNGYFRSGDKNQVSCYIYKGGKQIFEAENTYDDAYFSFTQDVSPGDAIDFIVGQGLNGFYNCTTPLKATISLMKTDDNSIKVTIDGVQQ